MRITYNKILVDSHALTDIIKASEWIKPDSVIVCCQPDITAVSAHILTNQLSHADMREQLFFEIPSAENSYVFNRYTQAYEKYDKYLVNWVASLDRDYPYLFLTSHIEERDDKNYALLTSLLRNNVHFQLGTLYLQNESRIIPSYSLETFTGPITYEWQK